MKNYEIAVHALHNGDQDTFKTWVNMASSLNILNGIEYVLQESLFRRHQIINLMRFILEDK